jgi:hypothetical protein
MKSIARRGSEVAATATRKRVEEGVDGSLAMMSWQTV